MPLFFLFWYLILYLCSYQFNGVVILPLYDHVPSCIVSCLCFAARFLFVTHSSVWVSTVLLQSHATVPLFLVRRLHRAMSKTMNWQLVLSVTFIDSSFKYVTKLGACSLMSQRWESGLYCCPMSSCLWRGKPFRFDTESVAAGPILPVEHLFLMLFRPSPNFSSSAAEWLIDLVTSCVVHFV